MIRILHVIHGMNCGGTENFIMNIYRNIDRTKIQFDFLVHTNKRCFFDDEIERMGGCIYRVPYYNILNIFLYKNSLRRLFSEHQEWVAVHGHLGSCACIYLRMAKQYGIYAIAHSHAIKNTRITMKELIYRFHAYLTRGVADYYMGCSYEAGVDRYGEKIATSNKFKIINNGIKSSDYDYNPQVRAIVRKELGINQRYLIGHIGRFSPVKNHTFMVEVLAELKKSNSDYAMIFVGDGELRESIENYAKRIGVYDSIIFAGIRNDIYRIVQAIDCFIFPSFNEGLGIGLIEAQAAGLPCVANKDGIMPLAKISELVEFIPLNLGVVKWATQINQIRKSHQKRQPMSTIIKNKGFDITDVSKWLEVFYTTQIK